MPNNGSAWRCAVLTAGGAKGVGQLAWLRFRGCTVQTMQPCG